MAATETAGMTGAASRRVVFTQKHLDEHTRAYLARHGCTLEVPDLPAGKTDRELTEDEIVGLLDGAAGWIVGHSRITRSLLERLPGLKVVSRRGVGYDRVDVEAVRDLGRVLAIAAGGNDASVADHTLSLMLAVGCRLRDSQQRLQAGDWRILPGHDLNGRTVGLIGFGRIGRSVARRLSGFDARVLVHARRPDDTAGVTFCDLKTLLSESDVVSVHAPLTPETRHLIDARAFGLMKLGAILVNTARGGLVDDAALLAALEAGRLSGAGLDVFESEGDPALAPVTQALLARPDVVATPHAAASSAEGLARTNMVAARAVVAVLDGGRVAEECLVSDGRQAEFATR